jgi:hypothetical protein
LEGKPLEWTDDAAAAADLAPLTSPSGTHGDQQAVTRRVERDIHRTTYCEMAVRYQAQTTPWPPRAHPFRSNILRKANQHENQCTKDALRERQLLAEGGCAVHRFHRQIADREGVPSKTALEQSNRTVE